MPSAENGTTLSDSLRSSVRHVRISSLGFWRVHEGKLEKEIPSTYIFKLQKCRHFSQIFLLTKSHAQSSPDLHFASQDDSVSLMRKLLQAPIRTKTRRWKTRQGTDLTFPWANDDPLSTNCAPRKFSANQTLWKYPPRRIFRLGRNVVDLGQAGRLPGALGLYSVS